MKQTVRIRGRGRVTVAAYGIADAEAQVEKELTRLWPEAVVRVDEISREGPSRIVEEFEVRYTVEGVAEVQVRQPGEAAAAAFRRLRERFEPSRYAGTAWEEVRR